MARLIDPLSLLRLSDRKRLLACAPQELFGRIMFLNRLPRYNYCLDAILLANRIAELRSANPAPGGHTTRP